MRRTLPRAGADRSYFDPAVIASRPQAMQAAIWRGRARARHELAAQTGDDDRERRHHLALAALYERQALLSQES